MTSYLESLSARRPMGRHLAAIMFTDIAGYTSLAQADEAAALRMRHDQERLASGLLQVHRGRLVKTIGDGLLIEFSNALDAVTCAVDLQRHVHERNAREPPPALQIRVGIHLGDVEESGKDILGDAVNVASRIEPLADPGGVCLSEPVFVQIRNRLPFQLEDLGSKSLKGVSEPVGIYRVALPWTTEAPATKSDSLPRLAVLPFANISPDPRDEYFADGMTEELITILSQLHELRVIARTSVIAYKAAPKQVSAIGRELGVSSILEGSVRKAGDRLRITVQLIDVASQEHKWAETYDREFKDVFSVQSDVAKRVADTLRLKLRAPEEARLDERRDVAPGSYLAYLRAMNLMQRSFSKASWETAKREFEHAIELDPRNARAYAGLAETIHFLVLNWSSDAGPLVPEESQRLANRAIELDPGSAEAHSTLGVLLYNSLDYSGAEREARLALSIDPSNSATRLWYSQALMEQDRPDDALRELQLAKEADPRSEFVSTNLADLLIWMGRLDEAKAELDRLASFDPRSRYLHMLLSEYYLCTSDRANALREVSEGEDIPDSIGRKGPSYKRAWLHACWGERERVKELLVALRDYPETMGSLSARAEIFAVLGDLDECFRLIDRSIEKFGGLGLQTFRLSPRLEATRRDPRFARVLQRVNLS